MQFQTAVVSLAITDWRHFNQTIHAIAKKTLP
jgi:hypothetical protein